MSNSIKTFLPIVFFILFVMGVIVLGLRYMPEYAVWSEGKYGEAELKKAEWNRQIVIKEAQAKKEAALSLASAEIERAKGVAEANRIIGESLKANEGYLRYLWINNLENAKNSQVIYVPTEAGLPILEAGRLNNKTNPTILGRPKESTK